MAAAPLEVMFVRQGGHLLAVEAGRIEEITSDAEGDLRIGFGPRLEGIFAPAERHVLKIRQPDGTLAEIEVGGQIGFGVLDSREIWPLPEFVRDLSGATGITRVFRSTSQDCIGYLVDPWRLPEIRGSESKGGGR
jgi:hypothetical protein